MQLEVAKALGVKKERELANKNTDKTAKSTIREGHFLLILINGVAVGIMFCSPFDANTN
ncbi:hypothetical protein KSZ_10020 [Dictyobacter formicarum]|uniref:Uncharacterized protein n=1 Tax=Dictyobacter formicarum TaxID=2778368 RepID=A0ABQ3VCV5_9CHLR|nr:hypothetical protein KSZ_10020 [Dictyobacter formicarum]